jgi:eukaryotic-like serine/threonine-protein kinase
MAAQDDDPRPMDRIGEYLIRRLVGEGGMGKVYEAEERLSKRRVALKVLRPELARSEEGRRLFLNEMTILAHLDHPNVVRCLACTEADGQLMMALEFLDGRTLRSLLLERRRLMWDEAVGFAWQITSALSIAHRQEPPIIHRDLKPENIMVLPDGTVKVMDFGIAKVLQAISRTTTHSVGTLQYMSPEQIDAHGVDARSDLYALGLVIYEMLNGAPPFESASPRELLNMQCTVAAPPLPEDVRRGVPSGIERLVYALLEKKADDRPPNADYVLQQLEAFRPAGGPRPIGPSRGGDTMHEKRVLTQPLGHVGTPAPHSHPGTPMPLGHVGAPAMTPQRADTIGLVERATAPTQIPIGIALAVILALSVLAGGVTYFVRLLTAQDDTTEEAAPAPVEP